MEQFYMIVDSVGKAILAWADPKLEYSGYTKDWPFTDFRTAFLIAISYVGMVVIGSGIMKLGVPSMEVYALKFVYNVSQIFLCAYMTVEAFLLAYRNNYQALPCNVYSRDHPQIANLLWLFYVSKIWDFWDTIFIIVGKKWRQLSFLHVYHHFTIFLFYWLNVNSLYDGDIYLTILLNGFIHTVMYTYYFICMHTKDPKTGESLNIWWKSSLTMMQMIQFTLMVSQAGYLLVTGCECASKRITWAYMLYIFSLFIMFAQFYVASYTKKPKKVKRV